MVLSPETLLIITSYFFFYSYQSEELDQLRFEVAHAKWHLSLYQAALMEVEGGIEAAAVQLEIVKEHHRPNCVDCERDQKWLNLAAARKHSSSPVLCRYTPKVVIQEMPNTCHCVKHICLLTHFFSNRNGQGCREEACQPSLPNPPAIT